MNVTLTNAAFHAVNAGLRPVTVESVCKGLRGEHHTLIVMERVFDIPVDTEINTALARLSRLIEREEHKRDVRHWSFNHNRLVALQQHHRKLSDAFFYGSKS